jgi:hypothetical protein
VSLANVGRVSLLAELARRRIAQRDCSSRSRSIVNYAGG